VDRSEEEFRIRSGTTRVYLYQPITRKGMDGRRAVSKKRVWGEGTESSRKNDGGH
jgi:hypothetical protein